MLSGMDRKSKILFGVVVVLLVLALASTFFKTVVLGDFDMVGMSIEIEDDSSYVWFIYENAEYEFEADTTDYDELLAYAAEELGLGVDELDPAFSDDFSYALEDALAFSEEEGDSESEDEMTEE